MSRPFAAVLQRGDPRTIVIEKNVEASCKTSGSSAQFLPLGGAALRLAELLWRWEQCGSPFRTGLRSGQVPEDLIRAGGGYFSTAPGPDRSGTSAATTECNCGAMSWAALRFLQT